MLRAVLNPNDFEVINYCFVLKKRKFKDELTFIKIICTHAKCILSISLWE